MTELSSVLKRRRKELGLTLAQIADAMGVAEATVQRWESGNIKSIRHEKIGKLAELLKVNPAELMGWEFPQEKPIPSAPNILPLPKMKKWKVLGGTACGEPIFKELDDESVWAPENIDADFVFRCMGDSMINARIFNGDIVFVKSGEVENGQIGVVRVGEEYTLKRIYHGPDYLELRSENPMYPPIIIRGEQENAEIVGKAVQFLSRVI
jgi:repressor LexA